MPPLHNVDSSAVKQVGYNQRARTLRVVFKGGVKYLYEHVPPDVYDAIELERTKPDGSVGKLLHKLGVTSRPGMYSYERIPPKK